MADLELTQGKLKEAKLHAQQAIESMRPAQGAYQYLSGAISELGEVLEQEGDLPAARAQFQQGLALRQQLGAADLVAESQVELAVLSIEEGQPEQAETLLKGAIPEFEKEKSDPDAAAAYTHLSHALLLQGKSDEARNAVTRAIQLTPALSGPAVAIPASIQKVRVDVVSSGEINPAINELRSLATEAKKLGYYNLECEARLELGHLLLRSNASAARPFSPGLRPMLELTDSDSLPVAPKPFSQPPVPWLACKNLPDRSRFRTRSHVFAVFPANFHRSHVSRNSSALPLSKSSAFQPRFL